VCWCVKYNLVLKAKGMSGRALRRLPVLALARYIGIGDVTFSQPSSSNPSGLSQGAPVDIWLDGMEKAVNQQIEEKEIVS